MAIVKPKPVVKRRPVAQPPSLPSLIATQYAAMPTPAQQAKLAAQTVADSIAQGNQQIDAGYRAQQAALAKQQERAHGFALAIGDLTKADPSSIAAQYREGADRLRAYGTGLTGTVAEDQQRNLDTARSAVSAILGPGSGSGPAVQGYDPAALRNAAQMSGVVLPGSTLEKQALDAYIRASYNRAQTTSGIEQISSGYGQKINDITAEIAAKKADLAGQRPALVRQALESAKSSSRSDFATLLSALGLMSTDDQRKFSQSYQNQTLQLARNKAKAAAQAAGVKMTAPNSALSKTYGYIVDSNGNAVLANGRKQPVSGWKLQADGSVTKIPTPKKPGSGASHMQSKTLKNGTIVLFDPATGNYYVPGDTVNPINPNTLTGKANLTPDKLRQFRAKATSGIAGLLAKNKKALPASIYQQGVASGVPGWIMVGALKVEALNHANDVAWQNVLKPGWVTGG
jgi:hypothetical protein